MLHKGLKSGMESGWLYIGFQLVYYMLGTTASSSGLAVTLEINFLLRLRSNCN